MTFYRPDALAVAQPTVLKHWGLFWVYIYRCILGEISGNFFTLSEHCITHLSHVSFKHNIFCSHTTEHLKINVILSQINWVWFVLLSVICINTDTKNAFLCIMKSMCVQIFSFWKMPSSDQITGLWLVWSHMIIHSVIPVIWYDDFNSCPNVIHCPDVCLVLPSLGIVAGRESAQFCYCLFLLVLWLCFLCVVSLFITKISQDRC